MILSETQPKEYIRCAGCHKKVIYEFGISLCNECEDKIYQKLTSFEDTPDKNLDIACKGVIV